MARSYRGAGTIRWGAQDGKDGVNYLIMGWWSASVHYKLTDAGIPVVKVEDTSPDKFSVYKLTALQSTLGIFVASEWEKVKSADFVYMQDAYIEHLQAIMVTAKTLRTDSEGARTEIDTEGIKVFNALSIMNIRFGLKNGYAVMEYYDNDGNLLYDLGPNGLGRLLVRAEGWTELKKVRLTSEFSTSLDPMQLPIGESYKDMSNATIITCYRYTSAISDGVNTDLINDGRIFNAPEISSGRILDSVYCDYDLSKGFLYPTKGTNSRLFGVDLPKFNMANEPVYDRYALYYRPLQKYASGAIVGEINAYWNHP